MTDQLLLDNTKRYVLYVPGMGTKTPYTEEGYECKIITFDYRHTTKAILDFVIDNYTILKTDRVKRLEDIIYKLYEKMGELYIIAHSHGGLLTHNALKNLTKKFGKEYTKNITVDTFGSAHIMKPCDKHYILKDATNVFIEGDWILYQFKNKYYKNLERNVMHTLEKKGCEFKVYISNDKLLCGKNIHTCYFADMIPTKMNARCNLNNKN
jgi:hypothetical protein